MSCHVITVNSARKRITRVTAYPVPFQEALEVKARQPHRKGIQYMAVWDYELEPGSPLLTFTLAGYEYKDT